MLVAPVFINTSKYYMVSPVHIPGYIFCHYCFHFKFYIIVYQLHLPLFEHLPCAEHYDPYLGELES